MNKSHYARGFAPLAVIIIIVALAATVGVLVYQTIDITPITPALEPQSDATSTRKQVQGALARLQLFRL